MTDIPGTKCMTKHLVPGIVFLCSDIFIFVVQ